MGRFLSEDPVFGDLQRPNSLHAFGYAGGNPANRVDPEGTFFTELLEAMSRSMDPRIPTAYRQMDAVAVQATLDAPKMLYEVDKAIVSQAHDFAGRKTLDWCQAQPGTDALKCTANATMAQVCTDVALLPLSIWLMPEALYEGPSEFASGAKQAWNGMRTGNSTQVGYGTARMCGVVGMYAGVAAGGMEAFGVKGPVLYTPRATKPMPTGQLSFPFMDDMPRQVAPRPAAAPPAASAVLDVATAALQYEVPGIGPDSVRLPYSWGNKQTGAAALQAPTAEALALRDAVTNGKPVYRAGTFGIQNTVPATPLAASKDVPLTWAPRNPLTMTPREFAQAYGFPLKNLDWVEIAKVKPGGKFVVRSAGPFGGNPGGALEIVAAPSELEGAIHLGTQ